MALRDYLAGEVAEDYADGFMTRREALRRLALLGLGLTSASALLAACGGDDDSGSASDPDSSTAPEGAGSTGADTTTVPTTVGTPLAAEPVTFAGPGGELRGVIAVPERPLGAVLVVHENRGLTPHFVDLVGRFAGSGYAALGIDLLSSQGGTAALTDPAAAATALAETPMEELLVTLTYAIDELERRVPGAKIGVVGFCFGGGLTWNLLQSGDQRVAAAVPFYGPAPEAPDFSTSRAAVLAIYASEDDRVNATRDAAVEALEAAGLTHEVKTFEGVDHAFFNDTGPRYDEAAATEAYALVLDWLGRHLA